LARAVAVLLLAVARADAQASGQLASADGARRATSAVDGVVRDSAGRPLPLVLVSADSGDRAAYSDSAGAFRLGGLPPGLAGFSVRRIGYVPSAFEIDLPADATVHLAITMKVAVRRLETVVVDGKLLDAALAGVGFYDRAGGASNRFGSGQFLPPEALEPWRATPFSTALRRVPSIRVDGSPGRVRAAFRDATARLGCAPSVWIDGELSPTPVSALDAVLPLDQVRGVEVYPWPRSVPLQFRVTRAQPTCGALVIWTNWLEDR
jgi:hypothetical protein